MVVICGKLVNTSPLEMLVGARIIVEVCDCATVIVSIMLVEPLEASTALEFVFIVPLIVLLANLDTFGDTGNDNELEGRGLSFRECSSRPGSPWLA